MNHGKSAHFVKRLCGVLVLVGVASCGPTGGQENPVSPGVENPDPVIATVQMVGRTCRAEVITEPNGATHYKSSYLNIYSDGSEQVQNVVETETPCP